jgi:hypothetical protein
MSIPDAFLFELNTLVCNTPHYHSALQSRLQSHSIVLACNDSSCMLRAASCMLHPCDLWHLLLASSALDALYMKELASPRCISTPARPHRIVNPPSAKPCLFPNHPFFPMRHAPERSARCNLYDDRADVRPASAQSLSHGPIVVLVQRLDKQELGFFAYLVTDLKDAEGTQRVLLHVDALGILDVRAFDTCAHVSAIRE